MPNGEMENTMNNAINEIAPLVMAAGRALLPSVVGAISGKKENMKKGGKKKKMKEHTTFEEYAKLRDSRLNEVGTSTADVAQFRRMTIPSTVRREWPDSTDDFFKRKKNSSTGCPCVDRE